MNDKVQEVNERIGNLVDELMDAQNKVKDSLKEILKPCGEHGCIIGTEDYCNDLFYVYAEPKPNDMKRICAVRLNAYTDKLEVKLVDSGEWITFGSAHIGDLLFLLQEVQNNIEYSDGYQDTDCE